MFRFSIRLTALACALAGPALAVAPSSSASVHDDDGRRAAAAAFLAEYAQGATAPPRLAVTTLADAGPGSLRDAVAQANAQPGLAVVEIDAALEGTIQLVEGALRITDSVLIVGPGADRLTLDAGGRHSVIATASYVFDSIDVGLLGVTIRGGAAARGAGIVSSSTHLFLGYAIVEDNDTTNSIDEELGGGLYLRGGSLKIDRSTFRRNSASSAGGGMSVLDAPVSIRDSTIQSNFAKRGGGLHVDTPYAVDVRRSLVTLNQSSIRGAGIDLNASGAEAVFENVTISSNFVFGDQPTASGGGMALAGSARISQSTIANNRAQTPSVRDPDRAAGLQYDSAQGRLVLSATLLWGNATLDDGNVDLGRHGGNGGGVEAYYSLIGVKTPEAVNYAEEGNLYATDPLLGPLADNGGPTWTNAIAANSPARDAVTWIQYYAVTDQRGFVRRQRGDTVPDIGAYEYGADRLFANGFDG